jgi:hypothetical protein
VKIKTFDGLTTTLAEEEQMEWDDCVVVYAGEVGKHATLDFCPDEDDPIHKTALIKFENKEEVEKMIHMLRGLVAISFDGVVGEKVV